MGMLDKQTVTRAGGHGGGGEGGGGVASARAEAGQQRPDLLEEVVQVLLLDLAPLGVQRRRALGAGSSCPQGRY